MLWCLKTKIPSIAYTMLGTNFKIKNPRYHPNQGKPLFIHTNICNADDNGSAPRRSLLTHLCSVRPRKSIRVFLLVAIPPSATLCEEEYDVTILSLRFKYGLIIMEATSFCQGVFLKKTFFVRMIQLCFFIFCSFAQRKNGVFSQKSP